MPRQLPSRSFASETTRRIQSTTLTASGSHHQWNERQSRLTMYYEREYAITSIFVANNGNIHITPTRHRLPSNLKRSPGRARVWQLVDLSAKVNKMLCPACACRVREVKARASSMPCYAAVPIVPLTSHSFPPSLHQHHQPLIATALAHHDLDRAVRAHSFKET